MSLQEYYAKRAREYEKIYFREEPSRQAEQAQIAEALSCILQGKKVIEVAAGTGYWTQYLAPVADRVVAIDINREVLEVARETKQLPNTTLLQADAFVLPVISGYFTGGLANFWFSHLKKQERDDFLQHFHSKMNPGAKVFLADNVYNEGVGGKLVTLTEDPENTYKLRMLSDGSSSLIVKNYPTAEELIQVFSRFDRKFSSANVFYGKHFWYVTYTLT